MNGTNQKPKVGDKVTVIKVTENKTGYSPNHRPIFVRVTKVGTKYLHGRINHYDTQQGEIVETMMNDSLFDMSEYMIYSLEFDLELRFKWNEFDNTLRKRKAERDTIWREIDYEEKSAYYKKRDKRLEEWDKSNPIPENPILPLLPKE